MEHDNDDKLIGVTDHGTRRMRKRGGLSRPAAIRQAARVLDRGLPASEAGGDLHRYMATRESAAFSRVTNGKVAVLYFPPSVYVFVDGALVTMFPVPQWLRASAAQEWKRWADRARR